MGDTPTPGETGSQRPLENKATTPTTPQTPEEKKTDDSEIEALRKKAEQAEMRANQLANELEGKKQAEAKKEAEELKRKEEYKTLYEQKEAELDELRREREDEAKQKAVTEATEKTLSDYSDEVKELAKDMGLGLKDATDDSIKEYKEKLDKVQARIGGQRMTPNNPGTSSSKKEYNREEMHEILNDPVKRDQYFRDKGGITAMMMNPQNS